MRFRLIPSHKLEKKSEAIGPGSFNLCSGEDMILTWDISIQRRRSVFESVGGGWSEVFSDSVRAACREALTDGVQGPAYNAPAGVQGVAPPEAPGF